MFWDKKAAGKLGYKVGKERGEEADCVRTNGNRCSVKHIGVAGLDCDEFPFKSVEPVQGQPPLNRCVPKAQNQSMISRRNRSILDLYQC